MRLALARMPIKALRCHPEPRACPWWYCRLRTSAAIPSKSTSWDGVTESLTTFKGKAVDVKKLGRELNVRYVLEGSGAARGQPLKGMYLTDNQEFRAGGRRLARGMRLAGILEG